MKHFVCTECDCIIVDRGGYYEGRKIVCRECGASYLIKRDGSHIYIDEPIKEQDSEN